MTFCDEPLFHRNKVKAVWLSSILQQHEVVLDDSYLPIVDLDPARPRKVQYIIIAGQKLDGSTASSRHDSIRRERLACTHPSNPVLTMKSTSS